MKKYSIVYYSKGHLYSGVVMGKFKNKEAALSMWLSSMYSNGYQYDIQVHSIRRA